MKLVVIGMPGDSARIASRSPMKHSSSASEVYRAKSSRCAGLTTVAAIAGAETYSQSPYRWPQNAAPQAAFRASRVPYRRCSQARKAAELAGE
jgi:hypothetical protein